MSAEKFYRQTQYAQTITQLVEQYEQATAEISKAGNFIAMSEKLRQHDKTLQIREHLASVEATRDAVVAILKEKTGRDGIVPVREFLDELTDKLGLVNQLRQNANGSKAAHEINIATGGYSTVEDRAKAEKDVSENRAQFDKGVELIDALVPAVSSILITTAPAVPAPAKLRLV